MPWCSNNAHSSSRVRLGFVRSSSGVRLETRVYVCVRTMSLVRCVVWSCACPVLCEAHRLADELDLFQRPDPRGGEHGDLRDTVTEVPSSEGRALREFIPFPAARPRPGGECRVANLVTPLSRRRGMQQRVTFHMPPPLISKWLSSTLFLNNWTG